jgi:hypothetical protein
METKIKDDVGFLGCDDEAILVIVYGSDGVPWQVVTERSDCDFEETKYGLQWHDGGSGLRDMEHLVYQKCEPEPPGKIWIAEGVRLKRYVDGGYGLDNCDCEYVDSDKALAMGYEVIDEPLDLTSLLDEFDKKDGKTTVNPFEVADESEYGFVWCSICGENFPDESECYCGHIFWDEGGLYGCGSNEVNEDDHKESFFCVLDKTGISGPLRRAMINSDYYIWYPHIAAQTINVRLDGVNYGKRFTDGLTEQQEEEMTCGVGWLQSLEPGKTRGFELLTVKWIDEWLGVRDERATAAAHAALG